MEVKVVMTMAIYAICTSSTLIPPSSTPTHDQVKVNGGDEYHADDYGIWNPSPGNWGRGRGAPIFLINERKRNHHESCMLFKFVILIMIVCKCSVYRAYF